MDSFYGTSISLLKLILISCRKSSSWSYLEKKFEIFLQIDRKKVGTYITAISQKKKHFQIGKFCVSSRQSFPKGMRDHFLFACFGGNRRNKIRGQGGAWEPQFLEQQHTFVFLTHPQSRFVPCALFGALGRPHLTRHTQQQPFISGVPEAMHKSKLRGLQGCRVGS